MRTGQSGLTSRRSSSGPEPASLGDWLSGRGCGARPPASTGASTGSPVSFGPLTAGSALCRIRFADDAIHIVHAAEGTDLMPAPPDAADWRAMLPDIPYSPGYGILER